MTLSFSFKILKKSNNPTKSGSLESFATFEKFVHYRINKLLVGLKLSHGPTMFLNSDSVLRNVMFYCYIVLTGADTYC